MILACKLESGELTRTRDTAQDEFRKYTAHDHSTKSNREREISNSKQRQSPSITRKVLGPNGKMERKGRASHVIHMVDTWSGEPVSTASQTQFSFSSTASSVETWAV